MIERVPLFVIKCALKAQHLRIKFNSNILRRFHIYTTSLRPELKIIPEAIKGLEEKVEIWAYLIAIINIDWK